MAHEHYEIAIIGGGIAGLTLALLCERLGFSYILFEKRDSLEGDNGAGIGLQANALRILDQLGVAEKVDAEAGTLAETYRYDEDGNQIMRNSALGTSRKRCVSVSRYSILLFLVLMFGLGLVMASPSWSERRSVVYFGRVSHGENVSWLRAW